MLADHRGDPWRRLVLPQRIAPWALTRVPQRLVTTGGRFVNQARDDGLLLAEGRLTRPVFGAMRRRIGALPPPAG